MAASPSRMPGWVVPHNYLASIYAFDPNADVKVDRARSANPNKPPAFKATLVFSVKVGQQDACTKPCMVVIAADSTGVKLHGQVARSHG